MYKEKRSEIVPLTRTLAEDFATMRGTPGERALRESRKSRLRSKYDDGIFHTPTWATAALGGVRYRVNGQHSSRMLLELNGDFPVGMKVHLQEFECTEQEDLATLFAQFDARDSVRSDTDVINSHGRQHSELADVSATNLSRIVTGLSYVFGLTKKIPTEDRARLLHGHIDFILWANRFVRCGALSRGPVIAAIYNTYKIDPLASDKFWNMVQDESHAENIHPTRVLRKFLNDAVVNEHQHKGTKKWSPHAFYVKCCHAWNAYVTGQRTQLKLYDSDAPVVFKKPTKVWE